MSDHFNGIFVALETDMREEQVEQLVRAIRLFQGVAGVSLHVVDPTVYIAQKRVENELRSKLMEVLYPMDRTTDRKYN